MRFEDLHDRFPEMAERETRTATVFEHPHLPAGAYAFTEWFCATRGCDCRRALILGRSREPREVVATLNYGWETTAFYKKWASGSDSMARMMTGVSVAPWGTQTEWSDALADQFASMVQDQEYAKRIQRHYAMFKQAVDATAGYAGDDLDGGWDDDLPDAETATEKECLAVLADFDVHPRREWFTMRAVGCDAANTLLQAHASSLAVYDRPDATRYVARLWELWLPETPCLETRYARAASHVEAARTAATLEEDLHHRRQWLEALEEILIDSAGNVRVDVLQALANEDWDLEFARLLRQAEWFLERAHRQSEDLPDATKVSVLDALIQLHERTGAVQKAESLRGVRDALLAEDACDDD